MKIKFRRAHLQTKIFLIFSVLLILSLCITSISIISMSSNLYIKEAEETARRDLSLITNNLESTLHRLSNTTISIAADSRVISAVKKYPDTPRTEASKAFLRSILGLNIGTIIGASTDVYMWDLFSLSGIPYGISGYDLSRLTSHLEEDFFPSAANKLRMQVSGIYYYNSTYATTNIPVFLISKVIVDLDTLKPLGLLLMVVRESRISAMFSGNTSSSGISYAVVDENDLIVSGPTKSHLGLTPVEALDFSETRYAELCRESKLSMSLSSQDIFYAISGEIGNGHTQWRVIMVNPMRNANSNWRQAIAASVFFCASACLVMLIASYYVVRSISRPVNHLVESLSHVAESGSLQPIANPGGSYEINVLYTGFNELLTRIQALIEHINQEQEEKSNYKFQLIQAQIKPHFLYNTLMTIKSLIDLDMNQTAGECIYAMSSFYRLSLNKGNDILSIGDEIELSMQYMYIQKLRYIDRLDYIFDIPRNLYHYLVPKLTIQPILENAIYHGVKEKEGKGVIEVTGRDLGDRIEFSISDNGFGMSEKTLEQLHDSFKSNINRIRPRDESFGLYSVNHRIHLLYGKEYGISIKSQLGEYTIVTLALPKNCH